MSTVIVATIARIHLAPAAVRTPRAEQSAVELGQGHRADVTRAALAGSHSSFGYAASVTADGSK